MEKYPWTGAMLLDKEILLDIKGIPLDMEGYS